MPTARHATSLKDNRAYRIEPAADPTYTPHIGALAEMLTYTRLTTLQAVNGLTQEELDFVPPGLKNSIGMLLAHIAAVHRIYQGMSFEGRDVIHDDAFKPYVSGLTMGKEGGGRIQGHPLDWYLAQLAAAQTVTLAGLAERDDAWLASDLSVPDFDYPNHHWAWFHVMEDEVSHRGQIRLIRQLLPTRTDELHED